MKDKNSNSEWSGWKGFLGYYDIRDCADVMGVSHKAARDFVKLHEIDTNHVKGSQYRLNSDEWKTFCVLSAERKLDEKRF